MKFSHLLKQSLVWRGVYFVSVFLVNVLLSRTLAASGSGVIFYISNSFAFVQLLAGLSFENGITYFAAGGRISRNSLFWFCLLWTAVIILLQLLILPFVPFEPTDANLPVYAFCFVSGLLLTAYSSNLFYTTGDFYTPNLILTLCNAAYIVLVLINYWYGEADKALIVLLYFAFMLVGGIVVAAACLVRFQSWRHIALPALPLAKQFIHYSFTVLLFNVLLFLVYRVDYYFVRYSPVSTASDLGNYIQASKLGQMMLVIPQIIGSAVYPQVSSGKDIASVSRMLTVLAKLFALIFFLLFFFVWLAGDWLFPFLFGATFNRVQEPLLLLMPGIFGLSLISLLSNFFSGKGNVSISVKAACAALFIVVAADAWLVPRYGIEAAAAISTVGYLVMCSFYLLHFTALSGMPVSRLLLWSKKDLALLQHLLAQRKQSQQQSSSYNN